MALAFTAMMTNPAMAQAATPTVSPTSVAPGNDVTISGGACDTIGAAGEIPPEGVTFQLSPGIGQNLNVDNFFNHNTEEWRLVLHIPAGAQPGTYTARVRCNSNKAGADFDYAPVTFTITGSGGPTTTEPSGPTTTQPDTTTTTGLDTTTTTGLDTTATTGPPVATPVTPPATSVPSGGCRRDRVRGWL